MKAIILILAMFIYGVCNAQISINNDTLRFDSTTDKNAVIWISSEYRFRMVKETIRNKKERLYAIDNGWCLKKFKLPKNGIFIIEYIYKKRNTKLTYINKKHPIK